MLIELLQKRLAEIVLTTPAPSVEILEFKSPARCHCHNDHYWGVFFATNAAFREGFGKAQSRCPPL